jgi:hypothetical protein
MAFNKIKLFTVTAAAAAALATAPSVLACDNCLNNDMQGGQICWSGFQSGLNFCKLEENPSDCKDRCTSDSLASTGCSSATSDENQAWTDYLNWDSPGGWWNWS